MYLSLDSKLERTLIEYAKAEGISPEVLALKALREKFAALEASFEPRDDWERNLIKIGRNMGVVLTDEDLSSDRLYD